MGRKKKADAAPTADTELVQEHELFAREALMLATAWAITTQEDMSEAGELKRELYTKRKALEERLKEITAPMRAAEKSVRDLFRPAISMLEKGEAVVTEALRQYELARMLERREALAEIEASGGRADAATLAIAHGVGTLELASEVASRRVFRAVLKDASLVEEKYIIRVIDHAKVQRDVTDAMGQITIPGFEIVEDIQIKNKPRSAS
jgi:hypothetical protein